MKFIVNLFLVIYIIQGSILSEVQGKPAILLRTGVIPISNTRQRIVPLRGIGNVNLGTLSNSLNKYVAPNQLIGYKYPSNSYYTRPAYPNQTGGRTLNDYTSLRDTANNPNSWIETDNDSDSVTDGSGLGIFTTESPPLNVNYNNNAGTAITPNEPYNSDTKPTPGYVNNYVTDKGTNIINYNDQQVNPKEDVLMVLISKKIEYQARPVVPENDRHMSYEIAYYIE